MPCTPPVVVVEGIVFSTSPWENAKELINQLADNNSDATHDGYDESIAGGNNTNSSTGIQLGTGSIQTTFPGPITATATGTDGKLPPTQGSGVDPDCPTVIPSPLYSYQLSPNYTVQDLCVCRLEKAQLVDLPGLPILARLCNLKSVALNILEPMRAKFGSGIRINSALRNENTVAPPGISQHCYGEAVDLQFEGWSFDTYWENAAWVRDNIKYDQFIFEHSTKTRLAWYHLSYKTAGSRPPGNPTKLMTMYLNKYSPGLQRYF